ncbi:MAG: sugar phosphate isomerase/epimerase family protein, partial [Candidatus Bathyarchaeia archaeon]
ERTAKLGYEAVEIEGNRPHMLPEDYTSSQTRKIRSLIESSGLKVAAITSCNGTSHWHFTHPNPKVRSATVRHVKACIDLASDLKAPLVQVLAGKPIFEGTSENESWIWLRDNLEECVRYAKSHRKIIGLEPEPGNVIWNSDLADKMIREVNMANLQLLIDIGHLHVVKENIPETVLKMGEKIAHVHVDDNDSTKDQHLIPGEGNIDFKPIIEALRQVGYSGYLSAEIEQGEGDTSAARAREYLQKLVP